MHICILHDVVASDARPDEQDVLVQAGFVRTCLERLGHQVSTLEVGLDLQGVVSALGAMKPDGVFNLVESIMRSGRLIAVAPALLDAMGIPYTGCPSHAALITSGKLLTKRWLRAAGLPTAEWIEPRDLPAEGELPRAVTPGRWIIKSVWEHASVGLEADSVVEANDTVPLRLALERLTPRVGGEAMVERFIDGREFNIALLGRGRDEPPEVLPPAEIEFKGYEPHRPKVVGFSAKWVEDSFEYQHTHRRYDFPTSDEGLLTRLSSLARECWCEFDLRGYARVDFRVDEQGSPWILEVNANPCISPDAGFMAAATQAGLTGEDVVARLVADLAVPSPRAG